MIVPFKLRNRFVSSPTIPTVDASLFPVSTEPSSLKSQSSTTKALSPMLIAFVPDKIVTLLQSIAVIPTALGETRPGLSPMVLPLMSGPAYPVAPPEDSRTLMVAPPSP